MSLSEELAAHLPYLRRYARALTGTQSSGDSYVVATLQTILEAPRDFPRELGAKVGLYRAFHTIWSSAHIDVPDHDDEVDSGRKAVGKRLARLTLPKRLALLLTALRALPRKRPHASSTPIRKT